MRLAFLGSYVPPATSWRERGKKVSKELKQEIIKRINSKLEKGVELTIEFFKQNKKNKL